MHNHLERNLLGYGPNPPDPQWPGEARIAVSFVLNYEEGGENTILNGDVAGDAVAPRTALHAFREGDDAGRAA